MNWRWSHRESLGGLEAGGGGLLPHGGVPELDVCGVLQPELLRLGRLPEREGVEDRVVMLQGRVGQDRAREDFPEAHR